MKKINTNEYVCFQLEFLSFGYHNNHTCFFLAIMNLMFVGVSFPPHATVALSIFAFLPSHVSPIGLSARLHFFRHPYPFQLLYNKRYNAIEEKES